MAQLKNGTRIYGSATVDNNLTVTGDGYFSNIALYDDVSPSHYLLLTNSANLTAQRTLSVNVNDADRTISLSGNLTLANSLTTSGNFAVTFTATATTSLTLPTSGTVATLADISAATGLSTSTTSTQSGYFGDIFLFDDSTPSHYLQITNSANLTAARSLSINVNDANRIVSLSGDLTLANNLTTSGNFALTLTTTAATNVTLPTTGTLATLAGTESLSNKTYTGSSLTVTGYATAQQLRVGPQTKAGTYSHNGTTTITVTITSHGLTTGESIYIDFTTLATGTVQPTDGYFNQITVTDVNNFTVTAPAQTAATGNCTVTIENKIIFSGTFGDGSTSYDHTVIAERLYGASDKSELLIFKGNDSGTTIQDNIRLAASGDIYFHTGFAGAGMVYSGYVNSFGNTLTSSTLTILASGNVGVATVNPGAKLEVFGTSRFGGTTSTGRRVDIATDGIVTLAYGNNANSTNLVLQNAADTGATTDHGNSISWQFGTNTTTTPINAGELKIAKEQQWTTTATTQDAYFSVSLALDGTVSEKIRVTSAGNLGVGVTGPSTKLDVAGIGQFTANGASLNLIGTDHTYIQWYPDGVSAGRKAYTGFSGSTANYFEIANEISDGSGHIYLNPGTNASVLIDTFTATGTTAQPLQVNGGAYFNGKLGVGVTNPTASLQISNTTATSVTDGAIWLNGGSGSILIDDSAQKRITWNDGGGNFNIRSGSYYNGTSLVYVKGSGDANGGAANITIGSDGVDGSIAMAVAPIGVPGATVSQSNAFYITSTFSYTSGGPLVISNTSLTGTASQNLQVTGGAYISGNLGVGVTNPGQAIDVTGSVRATSQLISTVATGTAPLAVTSTTQVNNLNAQYVNGKSTGTSGNTIPLLDGSNTFSNVQTIDVANNQILIHAGATSHPTIIHRNDGADYYVLLSAAGTTPSGTWNTLRPLQINLTSGLLSSGNGQSFSGGLTQTGDVTINSGELNFGVSANKYIDFYTDNGTTTFAAHLRLVNDANSAFRNHIVMTRGGATTLYHGDASNGAKLATTATGVDVTGNITVSGNLTINGTTTTINSTVTTLDDPIITLGGDTSTAETTKDRGIEFKWAGAAVTITNYIGNATTTVTGTVASTAGWIAGDIITISGATGTEESKLNGTWTIASVPTGTTFTFVIGSALATATYTANLGTTVRSKNGFFGLDQSSGRFTFIPQANNSSEIFSGTPGGIDCLDLQTNKGSLGTTAGNSLTLADFIHNNSNTSYLRIRTTRNANGTDWTTASTKILTITDVTEQGYIEFNNTNTTPLAFGSGATEFAKFLSTGNFGIGITPTEKLHVSGNSIITGNLTVSGGTITAGNVATALLGGNTTTNITIGSGLTTGTLTLGSANGSGTIAIGNTGTAAAQAVNIATATTGTITIGGTGAAAVQLPTGKTKVGQTFLLEGGAVNITLPTLAGTLYATGNTDVTLADGGTNASLTASAGSVVYSTASAMAFNTAGTSGQILVSKGTAAPAFESFDLALHAPTASYKAICRVATTTDLGASTFASNVLTGYSASVVLACTTTAGSAVVTTTSTAGIKVGATVSGNVNIPAGRTVASIDSATQFTLNSGTSVTAGTSVSTTFTNTIAALSIDGVSLAANDRVLVKDQSTLGGLLDATAAKYNGIYTVTNAGSAAVAWVLTRTADADVATDLDGAFVNISVGTANFGKSYKTRFSGIDTLNTTEMYWGRLVDVNSSSLYVTPTTASAIDIATDAETIRLKSGNVADLVTGLSTGVKTLTATAASTYTTASTVYIAGPPVASVNVTITTPYALNVASGNSNFGGNITSSGSLTIGTIDSSGTAALNIGTAANAKTITLGNATGATSIVVNCGTGALDVGANAIARTVTVGNTTGASVLNLRAGTGGVAISTGTTGAVSVDSGTTGAINIGTNANAKTVTIGNTTGASGTLINVGTAGAKVGYSAGGSGLIQAPFWVRLNVSRTKAANNTTLEAVFDAANDTIDLIANTLYYFRGRYVMSTSATASAAALQTGFIFSQTPAEIAYATSAYTQTASTVNVSQYIITAAATGVTSTGTAITGYVIELEGYFKSNATTGGTLIPAFTQSVAGTTVAPTVSANTWFTCQPVGSSSATILSGTWT